MFAKLALRNVRRQIRNYLIYFVTVSLSIALLFAGLVTKCIPYEAVKDVGHFLVEIMPVMFVPAAVGLLESWQLLAAKWLEYGLLTVVSTVAVMVVSGWVTQLFTGKGEEKNACFSDPVRVFRGGADPGGL